ncbi:MULTISPECIES: cytochrome c oxidase subunit II [Meiothermus]|uniref:cytochrome-c oxidase n=2 Tax=Meiothermus hypogaeus TaxID=884155 RepID=A0A511QYN4_9DEIN|nr:MULTISPECIES: cupredoxin domain-containing protein [Meiothermus]RIH78361.1 cytochrome c oxidase subunit 2 [Meiothermus hypogaeus]GEM82478.1 cytochrome c oxidase subunit 2 [Meiothermus hypogaeus NBRC 106114]GIW35001.1 MAG: cytochrome c oxidase subunit 2 [Meiothermus sp.]GIW38376.1 MAG: cytochrome c oxidase subunit 2 [Meiothermus sp.]
MEQHEHVIERYERAWILFGLAMITVFIILIGYMMLTMGNTNPVSAARIDATKVRTEGDFANPRVEQVGNEYVAYVQAFSFGYLPMEMKFKAGQKVTFYITSPDVQHGFKVENTNINVQVIPGEVAKVSYTFKKPGEYNLICNEYCGIGHANMVSKIVVEP